MGSCLLVLAIAWALAACGDDDVQGEPDAAPGDASTEPDAALGCEPDPPVIAALPVLTPCFDGWIETPSADARSPARCEPWPDGAPATCTAIDEAHFPGEPGCSRVGADCAADGWPADLPTDRPVVYVSAGADAARSTGRRELPYARIADAMLRAREGSVIAVAAGAYDEHVETYVPVEIRGACARATVLTSSAPRTPAHSTLLAYVPGVVLRDIRIQGGATAAIAVSPAGTMPASPPSLHLEGVIVEDSPGDGLRAEHGTVLTGHRVLVRRTGNDAGFTSAAVVARTAASVTLDTASIEEAGTVGLFATDDSTAITCTRCAIRGTRRGAVDGTLADGALASAGATITLGGAAIEGNTTGVRASLDGAVDVSDSVIRRGVPQMGVSWAAMVFGELALSRVAISDTHEIALATSTPAHIAATDVVVEDSRAVTEDVPGQDGGIVAVAGDHGFALVVEAGTSAELLRVLVDRSRAGGIFLRGDLENAGLPAAALSATDVTVRDTLGSEADNTFGRGIQVQAGSRLTFERIAIERAAELGIGVYDATIEGTDLAVTGIAESRCDACSRVGGIGLGVYYESRAAVARFAISDTSLVGVHVALGAVATLENGLVERSVVGFASDAEMLVIDDVLQCVAFRDVEDAQQTRDIAVPPALTAL